MRRRDNHLQLRFPMPQLDIGSLGPGERVIVQNYAPNPEGVAPQDDAPQQVESVAGAADIVPSESASDTAISSESASMDSTTSSGSTSTFSSLSSATSSLSSSASSVSSVTLTSSMSSSSSSPSPSLSSSSPPSTSLSSSASLASSAISAEPISFTSLFPSSAASSSTSPSTTSAAASAAPTITHGAPFYAAIALGTFILVACVATVIACLIRVRTRRREAAAIATIAWDPVVLDGAKEPTAPDLSLTGDRDVGEPKRSDSFLSSRPSVSSSYPLPFDTPAYQPPNPYVETAYYSPHQISPLADSTAYPLPPPARPPLTMTIPPSFSHDGPYPTVRPLPAHLADRDPHQLGISQSQSRSTTRMSRNGSGWRTAASSRCGSVRSHLPSATTLCVTNGEASRASTALGMHAEGEYDRDHDRDHDRDMDLGTGTGAGGAQSVAEFGTPREREARPRFMSLTDGRGLDVPWQRRESFAARVGGGGTQGWRHLPPSDEHVDEGQAEGQGEGWTQTLRTSVLGAFHAVTGGAAPTTASPSTGGDHDDGLTRAPTMGRTRRELGWRRFAREEREREGDLERAESVSSRGSLRTTRMPPSFPGDPPLSAISMGTTATATTTRTDNSRAPLVGIGIARPRPAALVSRTSSMYSTASASSWAPGYGTDHVA
ncbi:hypothetical protein K438DRAFT_1264387 [Mycena galopus ATCC 62051]|nr:hypothetical protein K438DRAFT_1264387 [Mycena galopus ATCC 62051]